jgi:Ni/Co efflux regulator RcnB
MSHGLKVGIPLALLLMAGAAVADQEREHGGEHPGGREAMHQPEAYPGPNRYQRLTEPPGWNDRPAAVDRGAYQHNYQAARAYRIGPYHRPPGWRAHHWGFGEFLPRPYWAAPYVLADYWLFALTVPPVGFEWVRDGADALLINTANGEILQVQYGVFG